MVGTPTELVDEQGRTVWSANTTCTLLRFPSSMSATSRSESESGPQSTTSPTQVHATTAERNR
ncbi:hypothetical protein [Streptomyces tricolor]|uniref:hypothetical protein n=1 Tax=Streptomyces tricolor TaxID=68277 RepID=UPI0019267C04